MTPNVPTSEIGTATLGMTVGAQVAEEEEDDDDDEADRDEQRRSTSRTDARIVVVRSSTTASVDRRRDRRPCSRGSAASTRSTVSMMLAPGWRKTMSRTAGFPFVSPPVRRSSTESVTAATSRDPDRRAVPVGDDERAVLLRPEELVRGARSARRRRASSIAPFGRFAFACASSGRGRPRRRGRGC